MTQGKSAQSVGRIGELSVELELTSRNWLVGNFNSNIHNAAVYDLFAVKKNIKRLIRVKSKDKSSPVDVKEEITKLVPGATLVSTSGFGDAVINNL